MSVTQLDAVGEWLAREVEAGRLALPLPPEKLAEIAGIILRAPSREPGRRARNKIATTPALVAAISKETHGAVPTARREP